MLVLIRAPCLRVSAAQLRAHAPPSPGRAGGVCGGEPLGAEDPAGCAHAPSLAGRRAHGPAVHKTTRPLARAALWGLRRAAPPSPRVRDPGAPQDAATCVQAPLLNWLGYQARSVPASGSRAPRWPPHLDLRTEALAAPPAASSQSPGQASVGRGRSTGTVSGVCACVRQPLAALGGRRCGWAAGAGRLSVLSHHGAKLQGVQEFQIRNRLSLS